MAHIWVWEKGRGRKQQGQKPFLRGQGQKSAAHGFPERFPIDFFPLADTYSFPGMEYCKEWRQLGTLQIDFALSVFFIVYFCIRYLS